MSQRVSSLAVLLTLLVGCGGGEERARAFVAATVADDARAREAWDADDLEGAREALERMATRDAPASVAEADVALIRRDAYERLGRLERRRADYAAAEAWLDRGLAIEGPDDLFLANLLTTRGRLHQDRGEDLEAAAAYHRALQIEEALLEALLDGPPQDAEEAR